MGMLFFRLATLSAMVGLAILGAARPASALDPRKSVSQYVHDRWTPTNGLPHPSITCIARAQDGHLWLGSPVGLIRFDGSQFTLFNRSSTPGLAGDNIVALMEADDGSLWISCLDSGLTRLRDGRFESFGLAEGLPDVEVRAMGQDPEGGIWAGTTSGLGRFREGRWERIGAGQGLTDGRVDRIVSGPDGSLWIVCDVGLRRWHGGRAVPFRLEEDGLGPDSRSFFWTRGGDLWELRDGIVRRTKAGVKSAWPVPPGMIGGVCGLQEDRNGNIWLYSPEAGLVRLSDGLFAPFRAEAGPQACKVSSFCEDGEGGFWFGTLGEGLGRLRDGQFTSFARPEGLGIESPRSIAVDREGGVWIEDVLLRDGRFARSPGHAGPAARGPDGSLWFATEAGLVHRWPDGREQTFASPRVGEVTALLVDRRGAAWLGRRDGLLRFDDGRWSHLTARDGLVGDRVRAIAEDRDGTVWVGTRDGGLSRFRDGVLDAPPDCPGLVGVAIEALHADPEGTLWIGTEGQGLKRLRSGKVATYTRADGLHDDSASVIVEDRDRTLWIGSARGIFRVNRREIESFDAGKIDRLWCRPYGIVNGLRSICVARSQHAAAVGPDGRVWFCTALGVSVIEPRAERLTRAAPPIKLVEIVVDDRSFGPNERVVAPPGNGNLVFRYTALSFVDPELTRFKYTLEGFDKDWHEAGPRREAFYTNIPPGSYRFRVMACNRDGVWMNLGIVRDLSIAPHLYQARWFYPCCAVMAALAVWAVFYLRVRRLRANARRLAGLVEERTRELRQEIEGHRRATETLGSHAELLKRLGQDLEDRNRRLSQIATTDALTGLKNRRYLDENLRKACERREQGHRLSIVLIDVDHFKQFNDTHGHPAGDEVLRQVGELILANLREGDVAARYGGEEFILLLPDTDAEAGRAVAERLRGAIESHAWSMSPVTASLGVATLASTDADPNEGLSRADQALYRSKRRGRNRVTLDSDAEIPGDGSAYAQTLATSAVRDILNQLPEAGEDLDELYDATVDGWVGFLDLRDHETEGHSRRVAEMTLRLARALGIGEPDLVHIRRGALLHDIGKMGVPDRILLKPGPLDPDEWRLMREHPRYAMELLSPIAFLGPALDIPYCHHERWDGGGYPRGLRGEEIPLPARIFAAVDIWDALSHSRPYREAWPATRVVEHICELSGSHLDPVVVSAFLSLLDPEAVRPLPPLPAASTGLDSHLRFELMSPAR